MMVKPQKKSSPDDFVLKDKIYVEHLFVMKPETRL